MSIWPAVKENVSKMYWRQPFSNTMGKSFNIMVTARLAFSIALSIVSIALYRSSNNCNWNQKLNYVLVYIPVTWLWKKTLFTAMGSISHHGSNQWLYPVPFLFQEKFMMK